MFWSLESSAVESVEEHCYGGSEIAGCHCAGQIEVCGYGLTCGSARDVHVDRRGGEGLGVDAAVVVEVVEG